MAARIRTISPESKKEVAWLVGELLLLDSIQWNVADAINNFRMLNLDMNDLNFPYGIKEISIIF